MDVWGRGASCRLPRVWGEGQRCQPPGPSPILFASKFLSNKFWGFPQPPTPDLSWKVWVPFSSPGRGWNRRESWGVSEPDAWGGEWAPSGHGIILGPGNGGWAASLPQTCTASAPSPARPLTSSLLPFCHGNWRRGPGAESRSFLGSLRAWDWSGSGTWNLPWLMPEPFASFLSPGLEPPIRPMSVTCFESPQQSPFRMHLTSTGRRDQLGQGQGCMMGVRYNPVMLCYHQRIPPLLHSSTGPAAGTKRPLLCDSGEGWEEGRWGGAQGTAVMPSEESPPGPRPFLSSGSSHPTLSQERPKSR